MIDEQEENEEPQKLFLQLPTCGTRADGKNMSGSQIPSGGHVGKMLVYKSGAVKWKIGEALYDVSHHYLNLLRTHLLLVLSWFKDMVFARDTAS